LKAAAREWIGTVACKYSTFLKSSPQQLRLTKDSLPIIPNSGWHFSWLGGCDKIYKKTLSCIEPFDKSKLPTIDQFREHFNEFKKSNKKFFIHLESLSKKETEFFKVEINDDFPKFIIQNKQKYTEYIT
jgi:hypothetical protein